MSQLRFSPRAFTGKLTLTLGRRCSAIKAGTGNSPRRILNLPKGPVPNGVEETGLVPDETRGQTTRHGRKVGHSGNRLPRAMADTDQ